MFGDVDLLVRYAMNQTGIWLIKGTSDIYRASFLSILGGFNGGDTSGLLLTRWYQYAALMPVISERLVS